MNRERPSVPASRPSAASDSRPAWRLWRRVVVAAWIAGAVVVWNVVFDAHIVSGARNYVDRQQLFIDGLGPHVDVDREMDAAKASGLRAAWFWTGVELAPGPVAWLLLRRRSKLG